MASAKELGDTMRDDYDFSTGFSGKYRQFIGKERTLKICKPDGSVTVETLKPTINLDEDVR